MRISDWSSDVCSSDLDQVGIVELVAVGLEDPVPCARLAVELLGDVRQRVAPLHGVGLLTDGFLGAARAALHVAEIGLGRVGFGAAGAALHVGEIRSEEQTSELQSLMRISYAVFCLKKKKTQYRT